MFDKGSAQLRSTGLSFNLLTHRLEILTLLMIHDPAWYSDHSDEFAAKEHPSPLKTISSLRRFYELSVARIRRVLQKLAGQFEWSQAHESHV